MGLSIRPRREHQSFNVKRGQRPGVQRANVPTLTAASFSQQGVFNYFSVIGEQIPQEWTPVGSTAAVS